MRATLVFNPNAAGTANIGSDTLIELLADVGYQAVYTPTQSERELAAVLENPGELVVVAGGDGSVRNVVLQLRGRKVPLAILPLGTANNIAHSLGLTEGTAELIAGLSDPERFAFDIGCIDAPWGKETFLEGCGLGLFAETMASYDPNEGKNVMRALQATLSTLSDFQARHLQLRLDGKDLTGDYVLVEVLNTRQVGPRLLLAPEADPSDGLFDLVLVHEDARVGFGAYLAGLAQGDLARLENIAIERGRHLEIVWEGSPFHFDERIQQNDTQGPGGNDAHKYDVHRAGTLSVTLAPGALELWLPHTARERRSP